MTRTNIRSLFSASGLALDDFVNEIEVLPNMSGVEPYVTHDWLHIGIVALRAVAKVHPLITSAACTGDGNGVASIAIIRLFEHLKEFYSIELLPELLETIRKNIRGNITPLTAATIDVLAGRDVDPLLEKVDLIYANLPLIMTAQEETQSLRATTTVTNGSPYVHLSRGNSDPLYRWSLLSQLGFLLSARERLTTGGRIVTLLGGRVPYTALMECFNRAELTVRPLVQGMKRQSDPEFLEQYAKYEREITGNSFAFFDEEKARDALKSAGYYYPGVLSRESLVALPHDELLKLLPKPISAKEAYDAYRSGKNVSHIAYAFEATL